MTEVEGSLELSSGDFVDDFDGEITAAQFGGDTRYMDEEGNHPLLLQLVIESDEMEKPRNENLSIGRGWQTDDGSSVRNDKGPKFNEKTRIGWWIAGMKEIPGCIEAIVADRGAFPQKASWWVGLRFHFKLTDLQNPVTKEVRQQLRPTAFLGFASGGGKPAAAPVGYPDELIATAKAAATVEAFQVAAVPLFPVLGDLVQEVADPVKGAALYAKLRAM